MLDRGFLITGRPFACRGVAQPPGQFPLQIGALSLMLSAALLLSFELSYELSKPAFSQLLAFVWPFRSCFLSVSLYIAFPPPALYLLLTPLIGAPVTSDKGSFL